MHLPAGFLRSPDPRDIPEARLLLPVEVCRVTLMAVSSTKIAAPMAGRLPDRTTVETITMARVSRRDPTGAAAAEDIPEEVTQVGIPMDRGITTVDTDATRRERCGFVRDL